MSTPKNVYFKFSCKILEFISIASLLILQILDFIALPLLFSIAGITDHVYLDNMPEIIILKRVPDILTPSTRGESFV